MKTSTLVRMNTIMVLLLLLPVAVSASDPVTIHRVPCSLPPEVLVHRVAVLFAENGYAVTAAFPELGSITGTMARVEGRMLRTLTISVAVSRDTAYVTGYYTWQSNGGETVVLSAFDTDLAFLIKGLSVASADKAR